MRVDCDERKIYRLSHYRGVEVEGLAVEEAASLQTLQTQWEDLQDRLEDLYTSSLTRLVEALRPYRP